MAALDTTMDRRGCVLLAGGFLPGSAMGNAASSVATTARAGVIAAHTTTAGDGKEVK